MTIAATHIPLGHSGLKVTPLWLGTIVGDQTDEAEAGRIVAAARDGGVNGIDTADSSTPRASRSASSAA